MVVSTEGYIANLQHNFFIYLDGLLLKNDRKMEEVWTMSNVW